MIAEDGENAVFGPYAAEDVDKRLPLYHAVDQVAGEEGQVCFCLVDDAGWHFPPVL